MKFQDWLDALPQWSMMTIIVLGAFITLTLVKRFILARILKAAETSQISLIGIIIKSVNFPLTLVLLAFLSKLFEQLLVHYSVNINSSIFNIVAKLLLILALVVFVDRLVNGLVGRYADRNVSFRTSKGIMQGITHIVILGLGLLMILSTIGISLTPIIASLGITSLALALALQPTLENFFSGIQLVIDKPIRMGDFIELDSGEQGFVEKIGW